MFIQHWINYYTSLSCTLCSFLGFCLNQIVQKHSESANLRQAVAIKDGDLVHVWLQPSQITLIIPLFLASGTVNVEMDTVCFVDIGCLGP